MYIPEIYKNEHRAEIADFLHNNSFGILVNHINGKLWATHIPLELVQNENGAEILEGHIAKENPQWESFSSGERVMAIFHGPHAYISSSWYDFEQVPTWNYTAVHVYGTITINDEAKTIESLKRLVDKYEATSQNPVRVEDLSRKTMMQVRGIVGFEIVIDEIHAVRKMSQSRDAKNYTNIISELEKTGNPRSAAVADEMKNARDKIFNI